MENDKPVMDDKYTEDMSEATDSQGNRGNLSWGFYVLVCGALYAVFKLIQTVLYFFN